MLRGVAPRFASPETKASAGRHRLTRERAAALALLAHRRTQELDADRHARQHQDLRAPRDRPV